MAPFIERKDWIQAVENLSKIEKSIIFLNEEEDHIPPEERR